MAMLPLLMMVKPSLAEADLDSFTVNKSGNVKNGVATISGTYECTGDSFYGSVELREVVGRTKTIHGYGSFSYPDTCDGNEQSWTVDIQPYDGKFAGGKATAFGWAEAYECDEEDNCDYDSTDVQQTVQLSGGNKGSLRH